jgi:hypothetical protein
MKKYRIITDGQRYRIQFRWWGIWRIETECTYDHRGEEHRRVVELQSAEAAKKWIETRLSPGWRVLG